MKKRLGIGLLIILLVCCGCAAAEKNGAAPEMYDYRTEMAQDDGAYSVERSSAAGEAEVEVASIEYDPLTYVTISQHTYHLNADDGTKLFVSRYDMPEVVTEDNYINDWLASVVDAAADETNAQLDDFALLAQTDYQNRAEEEQRDFYAYSYYCDISTERLDTSVISALQVNSVYSGGAHPNYAQRAYNLDLTNQTQLSLADVILPEGDRALEQGLLDRLTDQFGGLEHSGLYADYPEIVSSYFAEAELTPNWYFSDSALVIYFNCYDIAPYAAGIIKVEFPYEALDGILRPEYFPQRKSAEEGSIRLLDAAEGRTLLSVPEEGECLYLGTDQAVFDVKIYRLSGWLTDGVPMIGSMVFAANRLTDFEAVSLPINNDIEYLLTYRTGTEDTLKMVVNGNGIRKIVDEITE